eukprot:8322357-Pyramimonas_sp.AAC.1
MVVVTKSHGVAPWRRDGGGRGGAGPKGRRVVCEDANLASWGARSLDESGAERARTPASARPLK